MKVLERTTDVPYILRTIAPNAILVGSASRQDTGFNDLDFIVNERGLAEAKIMFPTWESAFLGNIKTWDTNPPIEVFVHWYGPMYQQFRQKQYRDQLITRVILGVELRAWPILTPRFKA